MMLDVGLRLQEAGLHLRSVAGAGLGVPATRWNERRCEAWERLLERRGVEGAAVGDVGAVMATEGGVAVGQPAQV